MRPRTPLLAALFLAVAAVLFAPGLTRVVFNSDEAFLATQAQVVGGGGRLYEDVVDRKPPVVPLLYTALGRLSGTNELWPMRAAAILARVAVAVLLAAEARRRWGGRAGLWAGLLFLASAAALPPSDAQAANFEIFMLPTMVAALLFGTRGRPATAGVALAVATLTKQTAAVGLLPLAYLAWRTDHPRAARERSLVHDHRCVHNREIVPAMNASSVVEADRTAHTGRLTAVVRLGAGFAAPIAATAWWFGPRAFLFWNYLGTGDYLDVGGVLGFALGLGVHRTLFFLAANTAMVALVVLARRTWRRDLDLWLWLLTGAVGVAAGLRFFEHYYLQLVPILCLLAARPLDELAPRLAAAAGALVAATAIFFQGSAFAYAAAEDDHQLDAVSEFVRARTEPDERILVWGHWPELYWRSERLPATRFVTTGFLTGHSGGRPPERVGTEHATDGAWEWFEQDLAASPPALVVVPLELRSAPHYAPEHFPRFGHRLDAEYGLVGRFDGVEVYERRDDQPAAATAVPAGAGASSTVSVGTSSAFLVE